MVARFAGASLGLFAFSVTIVAGMYAGNPATVVLSRAILALFLFLLLGFLMGRTAQVVISEHERARRATLEERSSGRIESSPSGAAESLPTDPRADSPGVRA